MGAARVPAVALLLTVSNVMKGDVSTPPLACSMPVDDRRYRELLLLVRVPKRSGPVPLPKICTKEPLESAFNRSETETSA